MNVTFDTNVFVSGFTRPTGRAAIALAKITANVDTLFVSQHIVDELLRVLSEKFGRNDEELAIVIAWMERNARLVAPTQTLHVLADEPDNRILECALAADADLIVTGDRAMLALQRIGNTRILSLSDYLDSVDNSLTNGCYTLESRSNIGA